MATKKARLLEVLGVVGIPPTRKSSASSQASRSSFIPIKSRRPAREEKIQRNSASLRRFEDADKRAAYDRFGHTAFAQVVGSGAGDSMIRSTFSVGVRRRRRGIFETFFGGGGPREIGNVVRLRYDMQIKLEKRLSVSKRIENPQARRLRQMQRLRRGTRFSHHQLSCCGGRGPGD